MMLKARAMKQGVRDMNNGEILMTTSFVARDVGVSEGTVDNLARSGRLPSIMITSKHRVFRKSDVDVCKAELRNA